jgi:proteic killer suppression protein
MSIRAVHLSKRVRKDLRKLPGHIVDKLEMWVDAVERDGLEEVRKAPGYHDEALLGPRRGQRSIRLSRSYRAIYVILREGSIEIASVEEISKHDY